MTKNKQNVLVFCAHSDDQIFGPGATLAKYSKKGKKIYTVIFSYGENSLAWLKPALAIKTRVAEAKKADKIIGGSGVRFFGLKEGKFPEEIEEKKIKKKLQKIIMSRKPTKIFTHSREDPHPDHRAVYHAVMEALDGIKHKCSVFTFDVWNPFTIKKKHLPRLYEDVSESFPKKIKALKVFESQKASLLALFWSVYVRAIVHGFHIHKRFAERFFKIR
ncbi:PIG-L family deacetylase [Candidatus Woesearchaeota archaeon]|nr:PIG-L family deacetylase [Candidatus Woesearchaeota archaeon]